MKSSNKNCLSDQEIIDMIQLDITKTPPPPLSPDQAWLNITAELDKKEKRNSLFNQIKKSKLIFGSCVATLFISFLFWNPVGGTAFFKITDIYQKITGSVIQVFMGHSKNYDSDIPNNEDVPYVIDGSEITTEELSLEEAQLRVPFKIKIPTYIPSGMDLEQIYVSPNNEVTLLYQVDNKQVSIEQTKNNSDFGLGFVVDNDDATVKNIKINGNQASLIIYNKVEFCKLAYLTQSYSFVISGFVSPNEIIQIAESIK